MTRVSATLLVQLIEDMGVVLIDESSGEEIVIPLPICNTVAREIQRLAQADADYAKHRANLRGETQR